MVKYISLVIISLLSLNLQGQIVNQTRALDDNHAIAADSTDWIIHRALKEIGLSEQNEAFNISLGGEIRQRTRFMDNINYGDVLPGANDRDIFWTQRYMLHSDLTLGSNFRLFGQINSSHVVGKDFPGQGIDVDEFSVMQSFIEFRTNGSNNILLRTGRQDIGYGTGMVIGTRDGPNVRQTYDGVFTSITLKSLKADLFIVRPVKTMGSYFDNHHNKNCLVLSSYNTINLNEQTNLEFYYFGSELKNAVFRSDTATDRRHSLGGRLSSRGNSLEYSFEFTGQIGKFANKSIQAYQAVSEISYSWNTLPLKPKISSRQLVISGDNDNGDDVINIFRPVSARPPVNEMVAAGSSNVMLIQPALKLELFKNFSITGSYYAVWRQTAEDGIYTIDLNSNIWLSIEGPANEKFFTQGIYGAIEYQPNYHFLFSVVGCMFKPGIFLESSGQGQNLMASELRLAYWF